MRVKNNVSAPYDDNFDDNQCVEYSDRLPANILLPTKDYSKDHQSEFYFGIDRTRQPTAVNENIVNCSGRDDYIIVGKEQVTQNTFSSSQNKSWTVNDFVLGKPLGKGKFGNVYAAKQRRTNTAVALKVLFKAPLQSANCVHLLRREVELQHRLKHPNIVQLYGYFHDAKNIYLLLEHLGQGELFKHLQKQGGFVSESLSKDYMRDIASAIYHMHQRFVYHR